MHELTCLEICAGAGGQSLGLEQAGFSHAAAVEIDRDACETLRLNRQHAWKVVEADVHHFDGRPYHGIDLLAGGVPCPPFSVAGRQLGADDERDLFPQALRLVTECEPMAVMLENVPGLSQARFASYREQVLRQLGDLGYEAKWQVLNACEFGVPQLRPRFILTRIRLAIQGARERALVPGREAYCAPSEPVASPSPRRLALRRFSSAVLVAWLGG
ncbi:MAG TPA: DNA (cytosine-5-)-methyltransferase [Trebonia sp.]|nr:DNA (cytosine-5-)-methyltransferase [Trebonia sp.]